MREQLIDFLRRELVGPDPVPGYVQVNGEEILVNDPPRIRYGAGVLFPQAAALAASEDTETSEGTVDDDEPAPSEDPGEIEIIGEKLVGGEAEEAPTEDALALANAWLPSAMGVSFLVELRKALQIDVEAAHYIAAERLYEVKGEQKKGIQYERKPLASTPIIIPGEKLGGDGIRTVTKPVETEGMPSGLVVRITSRPRGASASGMQVRLISATLINTHQAASGKVNNEKCFFQVSMRVSGVANEPCFLEYPEREGEALDLEDQSMRLLYRHRKTFAVGHGCAAGWIEEAGRATRISTDILPVYEVTPVVPTRFEDLPLSMLTLSDLGDEAQVLPLLSSLCDRYEAWIAQREAEAEALEDHGLQEAAGQHLANCKLCLERMRLGIETLAEDPDAMLAFRLANRAMLLQQLHYALPLREWQAGKGGALQIAPVKFPDVERPPPQKGSWYPFQLGFILMNIRSLAVPLDPERSVVDLIWFPTGGGKTEAYLGLTAYTIFLRRLRDPANGGVTVLMRYTLRLLTAQQFQRAATLICACDVIRRAMPNRLGSERVSIGLWVGKGLTKNSRSDALKALNDMTQAKSRDNPFVVLRCPWCSAQFGLVELGAKKHVIGYRKQTNPMAVVFQCPDKECAFGPGELLPLFVVDDDVYAAAPSLLIGTVDKFATLPWRPEARSLFALDSQTHTPPDLIIQDELHLISGPLGSMVGHYEGVIEELATSRGASTVRPKIVASTATICRAQDQVLALYGRDVFQFPPQCLRAGDSFFAFDDAKGPGRVYVGVHASALPSAVTAQVRVFAALLQGMKSAEATSEKQRDPYFTLVCYFNSLRELGHAATLLRADIREYLNAMWLRKGISGTGRRFINNALELTSRIPSAEIPEALQLLERTYASETDRPVDVCLASSMMQVGVDVPRLGLMAVVGQPKTTSEYIQATSRVGRDAKAPGLVVTLYNTAKPRDRSHYEHFRSYHASLYRQVEPTSVTPFAAPVRERALHALLVTLVRFLGSQENQRCPQPYPSEDLRQRVLDVIAERVSVVDPDESAATIALAEDLFAQWKGVLPPRYGDFGAPRSDIPLMYPAGSHPLPDWNDKSLATPSSMRNVDANCEVAVIGQYPQPEEESL